MAKTYCSIVKADATPGRAEREAKLSIGNKSSNGIRIPQKVEADFPESELPDNEAWEKERKTALALIQNALKFCVRG
jgi:hypothetical protein